MHWRWMRNVTSLTEQWERSRRKKTEGESLGLREIGCVCVCVLG